MKNTITKISQIRQSQRGQVLIFTAFILPFFIAAAGLAIDFGNMYLHKSKLQNATDAATIAGAYAYANNAETVSGGYDIANQAATASIALNHPDASIKYQALEGDDNDGTVYYATKVTETVPIHFLSYFTSDKEIEISASSYAKISRNRIIPYYSNKYDVFENIFTIGDAKGLTASNYNRNYTYSGLSQIGYFNTPSTYTFNTPDGEKMPTITKSSSINSYLNTILNDYKNSSHVQYIQSQTGQDDSTLDINNEYIYLKGINLTAAKRLGVGHSVATGTDYQDSYTEAPLYVIYDIGTAPLVINAWGVMSETGRPLVVIYLGTGSVTVTSTSSNRDAFAFHGIIYAPYTTVTFNSTNLTFYGGSVVAPKIVLNGSGTFRYPFSVDLVSGFDPDLPDFNLDE